jgi:hypothetical protein
MLLLRIICCCCLLPVHPVTRPTYTPPVIKIQFIPDRRPENPLSDSLFYHANRKLRWSDFKGKPPVRSSQSGAVSYTSFAYEGSSLHKKDTLQLNLTLQVFFVKSASWAKSFIMDNAALAHEQLHFDITWLVGLRFQQKIKTMPLTIEDYDSIIQYQYLESFREMNRLQDAYDEETRHGQSLVEQLKWKRNVAEAITAITVEGAITSLDSLISRQ